MAVFGLSLFVWVIILVLFIVAVIFIYFYNRFAVLENRIENSSAQIDVQLRKRSDLIPNLMNAVKGFMKHEKSIFKEVTDARKELVKAGNLGDKVKAGDHLQSALKSIFAIAEGYPELKSNQNFLHLQQELSAIEDKVAYARQFYNDSVLDYSNLFRTFPGNQFAKMFSKKQKEYLKIPQASREVPKVEF